MVYWKCSSPRLLTIIAVLTLFFCGRVIAASLGGTSPFQPVITSNIGSGSISTAQVNVFTTATLIVGARPGVTNVGRISVTISNNGSYSVYIGNSNVSAATGKLIVAGGVVTINTTAAIYGISPTGTDAVDVLETY